MWDLIVSVPDHCLSFYFSFNTLQIFTSVNLFVFQYTGGVSSKLYLLPSFMIH